jgi:hypothetical protein
LSISSLNNDVVRYQKDIADLQQRIADESRKEASKIKDLSRIENSITKTTSASSFRSKQQEISRIMDDISKIQSKKAEFSKKKADQNDKLFRAKLALDKEEERERKKVHDANKKRENEQLSHQRAITQELKTQYSMRNQPSQYIVTTTAEYDVFISHASEDKETFVKPLVAALKLNGYKVWYDEFTLKVGDSLRRSIDNGLVNSRYGIVILSSAFFAKNWTQYELDGLVTREMQGHKVILPIWHLVTKDQVQNYSPSLADKKAINSSLSTISEIITQLAEVLDDK